MHMVSQSSGEFVCSDLAKSTIPLSWDDPTHPTILRQPLVSVFNGIGNQTKGRGNERPLTSFLLTINFKTDDDMRQVASCINIKHPSKVIEELKIFALQIICTFVTGHDSSYYIIHNCLFTK